jgi:hypothetical protein
MIRSREGVLDNTMNTQLKLIGAVAGLAFAASSQAQQAPLASIATPAVKEWVRCHGVTSVQMTADAEQTLPLQVTGTLACGDEVAVLSDVEGYTVNVRTADGKYGYVARMYLSAAAPARSTFGKPLGSATVENNVAHWTAGTTGSDQFLSDESVVESLTVNGVTVQVTLHDTGWKLRANVAVANDSHEQVYVNPSTCTLNEFAPSIKLLAYQDPKEMARSVSHGVLWTSTSATSPSQSPATMNASYKTPFVSTQTPNYLVQAQSEQLSVEKHDVDLNTVHQIHNTALREGPLGPVGESSGAVWFERDKKAAQLVLRVPVGQTIFEFPLSFNHNN